MIALVLLAGCATSHPEEVSKKDSIVSGANISDHEVVPELSQVMADYEKSTRDTLKVDTTLQRGSRSVHISFRHYALNDSALHIPDRYTELYKIKDYVTHNFVSSLTIVSDGVKVLDTVIRKELFNYRLQPVLKEYAVLFAPNVYFREDGIKLQYSISIPLTDVGEGHVLLCSYTGELDVE